MISQLIFRKTVAVYCGNQINHQYTLWTKCQVVS